jgi:DNA polymerase-3 subunit chi
VQVDFYQLAGASLDQVLPRLAERVLAEGERLLVVADDSAVLAHLDALLWRYAPESFLPHGRAGEGDEADQPILLATEPAAVNGAKRLAIVDGRWRDEALAFERSFYLFDNGALDGARAAWRALGKGEGVERRFWKRDEDGRWREGP